HFINEHVDVVAGGDVLVDESRAVAEPIRRHILEDRSDDGALRGRGSLPRCGGPRRPARPRAAGGAPTGAANAKPQGLVVAELSRPSIAPHGASLRPLRVPGKDASSPAVANYIGGGQGGQRLRPAITPPLDSALMTL